MVLLICYLVGPRRTFSGDDVHEGEIQVPHADSEPIEENSAYAFIVLPLLVTDS